MQTGTATYTKTDIRRVVECFHADLSMLVARTGTMTQQWADDTAHDIRVMSEHECVAVVHVQLLDANGRLVAAHKYDVLGVGRWDQGRPGANNWPEIPRGMLVAIVYYKDAKAADIASQLRSSLRLSWGTSHQSIDYSGMRSESGRQYSSQGYGWNRSSFTT